MKFPASFFFWLKKNQLHLLVGIEIFSLIFFFFFGLLVIAPNKNLQKQKVLGFRELLPTPVPYPVNRNAFPSPEISGQAAIVVDFNSLAVLYQKNPDLRLFPASLTKIMTAVIAMENYPLTEVLT
ncbi:MAG: D-alanyl-D-alanine carboxypeptidase, partial [Patescibacteria group bacterium]|nr:D-alanyl-D-alanine carboxypeptidase [Patescibacteria group bacterium]